MVNISTLAVNKKYWKTRLWRHHDVITEEAQGAETVSGQKWIPDLTYYHQSKNWDPNKNRNKKYDFEMDYSCCGRLICVFNKVFKDKFKGGLLPNFWRNLLLFNSFYFFSSINSWKIVLVLKTNKWIMPNINHGHGVRVCVWVTARIWHVSVL